jgi:hypothetical protein
VRSAARVALRAVALALLLVAGLVALAGALALERAPRVAAPPPPGMAEVAGARGALGGIVAAVEEGAPRLELSSEDLDAVWSVAGRLVPRARLATELAPGEVTLRASLPGPFGRWMNLVAVVPSFDAGLTLARVRLGALPLPPRLTAWALGQGVERGLGLPAQVLTLFYPAVEARAGGVTLARPAGAPAAPAPSLGAGGGAVARLLATLRGAPMPTAADVAIYRTGLADDLSSGALRPKGSFLPHLTRTLARAAERGAAPGRDIGTEATAALLALARDCGSEHIRPHVGRFLADGDALAAQPVGESPCGSAGFHGRVDQRRHFITAAALRAASTRHAAIVIGELKELDDMRGAGFDFTDLMANQSGIRLADRLLATPAGDWPALLARMTSEADVIGALDGLPGETPRDAFRDRIGGLDTPAYRDLFRLIEERIDRLPLHAADP